MLNITVILFNFGGGLYCACKSPLRAFKIGINPSGKPAYKICSSEVKQVFQMKPDTSWSASKEIMRSPSAYRVSYDYITIPCGQCLECRFQYARQWADRCILELQSHPSSYFLTLTYDNQHIEHLKNADGALSLKKRDLQLFHKKLNRYLSLKSGGYSNFRYFACGEYGDNTFRPHYHDIVFGLVLDDLVFYRRSELGHIYYNSPFLEKVWGYGHVIVGEVTWESCAYTARYVTKKQKGFSKNLYEKLGVEPEFLIMSRRPGIAREYYDTHPDLYDFDCIHVSTSNGGRRVNLPRYFDTLKERDDPDVLASIRERRMAAAEYRMQAKLYHTDLDELEMLAVEEANLNSKLKIFKRSSI